MKRKNIKVISLFLVLIILTSVIVFRMNNNYKNEIGGYDIYTLVMLENELDDFIELYNSEQIDVKSMDLYQDKIVVLNEYIRRSPVLRFMNIPLDKISDYNLDDINEKDIEWMRQIQKKLKE